MRSEIESADNGFKVNLSLASSFEERLVYKNGRLVNYMKTHNYI